MKIAMTTVFFFVGALIGYFIHPEPKLEPKPKGFVVSYQAGITNNMTKIGNLIMQGPLFTEAALNQAIGHIQSDTNVNKGSITILNAVPIY